MEERRPGQRSGAQERPAAQGVYEQASPKPQPVSAKEKAQIADAQKRAQRDREEALATGHGDHKGEEGN